jgi:hypothetical protein
MCSDNPRKSTREVMTVERLRKYLFGTRSVSFWDHDPQKLTIGLEVEYFIGKTGPSGTELAKRHDYLRMINQLTNKFGYVDRGLPDQPGRVSKDAPGGYIIIKPDFAWHILEISLPPVRAILELRSILNQVLSEIDVCLKDAGLTRIDSSCLKDPPVDLELVELKRLQDSSRLLRPACEKKPTQNPLFPAFLASTHIHLNICSEDSLSGLPKLYAIDKLLLPKISRAREFKGKTYENVRTRMYADTLGPDYLLHTYPMSPASDLESLAGLMNQSPGLYPSDPFFPVRDMSYIRPTRYGTMEFRSACSFMSIDELVFVAECRIAQVLAAYEVDQAPLSRILGNEWKGDAA